jgi:hypothetical protein
VTRFAFAVAIVRANVESIGSHEPEVVKRKALPVDLLADLLGERAVRAVSIWKCKK